jgi:type VI secretion system secreted protein Hcp
MAGNIFLKFKEVAKGESTETNHPGSAGWIQIDEWDWEIEAESSFTKGTGAAVGKPTPGAFNFTHFFDTSSPTIMKNIVMGVHFAEVEMHMLKQTGSGSHETYFIVKLTSAFTTKVSTKGGEDGSVSQDVSLVFKDIEIEYKPQGDNGKLQAGIKYGWNVSTMVAR